jgi:hypothetical protein
VVFIASPLVQLILQPAGKKHIIFCMRQTHQSRTKRLKPLPLYSNLQNLSILLGKVKYDFSSVAEPNHFDSVTAPGKNFDATPAAPDMASTLILYILANF